MSRVRWGAAAVLGVMAVLLGSGCGPDAKDMQIQKLQEDVDRLTAERDDLQNRLAVAQNDAVAAKNRALELQRLLDEARRQLAEKGTEALPEGWEGTRDFAWIDVAENILFDSGKADLKSAGRARLQEIVRTIQSEFPGRTVWVIGHTDTDPIKYSKWKDNLELSCNRGMTVVRELYRMGIEPSRLVAGGQGEHNPKAPNTTRAGKAQNRRVQIAAVRYPAAGVRPPPVMEEVPAGAPGEASAAGAERG